MKPLAGPRYDAHQLVCQQYCNFVSAGLLGPPNWSCLQSVFDVVDPPTKHPSTSFRPGIVGDVPKFLVLFDVVVRIRHEYPAERLLVVAFVCPSLLPFATSSIRRSS